jgi:AhpD family alkylhydroperoxidase
MARNYAEYFNHIRGMMGKLGKEIPGTMGGIGQLHKGALEKGALEGKIKELIAVGIAIAVRCEGCMTFHIMGAVQAGATREEVVEAIGVGIMMAGGPGVIAATEAFEILEQTLAGQTA